MEYKTLQANDSTELAYQASKRPTQPTQCILLLHGFSGSSQYFQRNFPSLLDTGSWIVAPDMRGHGRSQHTDHGYHVARLAMDLHAIITHVISADGYKTPLYAVGCSIGAAVLWTYVELFTDAAFAGFVFVDQAPLQDRSLFGDWNKGMAHYSCYDEATMLAAQGAWSSSSASVREDTYRGLVHDCLGYLYAPSSSDQVSDAQREADEDFFTSISRSCDGVWLAKLLADHTRYDHREAIAGISKPTLVMAGRRSGCFSLEAQKTIVTLAQGRSDMKVFECGHWLFWEQVEEFNKCLWEFIQEANR